MSVCVCVCMRVYACFYWCVQSSKDFQRKIRSISWRLVGDNWPSGSNNPIYLEVNRHEKKFFNAKNQGRESLVLDKPIVRRIYFELSLPIPFGIQICRLPCRGLPHVAVSITLLANIKSYRANQQVASSYERRFTSKEKKIVEALVIIDGSDETGCLLLEISVMSYRKLPC